MRRNKSAPGDSVSYDIRRGGDTYTAPCIVAKSAY